MAPDKIIATKAEIGEEGAATIEIIAIATEPIVTTEPAKPSTQSIKLIAFVIPTIQSKLIGYAKKQSTKSLPNE